MLFGGLGLRSLGFRWLSFGSQSAFKAFRSSFLPTTGKSTFLKVYGNGTLISRVLAGSILGFPLKGSSGFCNRASPRP